MSAPLPVQIIRPKATGARAAGTILGGVANLFLRALFVWWLAPSVWDGYALSFWQTLALVLVVAQLVRPTGNGYLFWTKEAAA